MNEQSAMEGHRRLMAELRTLLPPSAILDAFDEVPRHRFLPGVALEESYRNRSVATVRDEGKAVSSCSQPSWVARVIGEAGVATGQRVLEIGSGTGWSATILARVVGPCGSVVTVDIDQNLVDMTRANLTKFGFAPVSGNLSEEEVRLDKQGFGRITTLCQDGFVPTTIEPVYHAIMVTAMCRDIAPCWHQQLAEGGRLVLPLTLLPGLSVMVAFAKRADRLVSRHIELCKAVALRGEGAHEPIEWRHFQLEAFLHDNAGAAEQTVVQRRHHRLVFSPVECP
ncbi:MAG: class I SAM-dependent methyltransferase [Planctomycetaceae bacterium]|nr:class I SAM-dependent methyltransferase [Planctomycetales bacterium]MCB9923390.1 class I SAM-dependent methyltransferase [Planctomycetaceae bacterium]